MGSRSAPNRLDTDPLPDNYQKMRLKRTAIDDERPPQYGARHRAIKRPDQIVAPEDAKAFLTDPLAANGFDHTEPGSEVATDTPRQTLWRRSDAAPTCVAPE
jgi:hypothetical protein